jgi:hypothetical protein
MTHSGHVMWRLYQKMPPYALGSRLGECAAALQSIYAAVDSISRGVRRTGLILPARSSSVARSALTGLEN